MLFQNLSRAGKEFCSRGIDAMRRKFGVHGVELMAGGGIVIGRCFEGPINIGDGFSACHSYDAFPPEEPPRYQFIAHVDLEVVKIEAYGFALESLDSGMTARIVLRGAGLQDVLVGSALVI